ncbi:MAG TPA: hypothetical protein RMH99_28035 [Sandaracinaceae bacterium LLY-WYZ-13_1]|nr:hypothetical protein [Sandaracinaceae bacterium LLY-WYZ-13_1]
MLTLDALRRTAERMPSEPASDGGKPPYRRPDDARRRRVTLPPVAEEVRRAVGLFAFVVGVAVAVLTAAGLVVAHGRALAEGRLPEVSVLRETALWYAGWTALLVGPFAAAGLGRELLRYRAVRDALGPSAWLDARGRLTSEDGSRTVRVGGPHGPSRPSA